MSNPETAHPQAHRIVKSGDRWRLGWDPQGDPYQGLVAGDNWAIELTAAELDDFCRLLGQLAQTMSQMREHLMEQERICCEAESDLLWLEVEGFPDAYSLRLILNTGRRGEGSWSAEAVRELVPAAVALKGF